MDRRTKAAFAILAILLSAAAAILAYTALAPQYATITGFQAISTNPGLGTDALAWDKSAAVGQNLTACIRLSPQWPVIVNAFSIATPGFEILSLNASLPLLVDQNTTVSLAFKSNQSYSGSVLLLLAATNASGLPEKILVTDVVVDGLAKIVTSVTVYNAGDVVLTNSTAYLIRSDGFVAGYAALDTAGQLPGRASQHAVDISNPGATILEIYHVVVATAGGANATSRAIWFCNC